MHLCIYQTGDSLCIRQEEWIIIIQNLLVLITPSSQRKASMSFASCVNPARQKTFILFCAAKPGSRLKPQKLKGFFFAAVVICSQWHHDGFKFEGSGVRAMGMVSMGGVRLVMTVQQWR